MLSTGVRDEIVLPKSSYLGLSTGARDEIDSPYIILILMAINRCYRNEIVPPRSSYSGL